MLNKVNFLSESSVVLDNGFWAEVFRPSFPPCLSPSFFHLLLTKRRKHTHSPCLAGSLPMAELKAFGLDLNILLLCLKNVRPGQKKIKKLLDKNEAVNYFAY